MKTYRVRITTIEYGEMEADENEIEAMMKLSNDEILSEVDDGSTWGYGRYKVAEIKVDDSWKVIGTPDENIHD